MNNKPINIEKYDIVAFEKEKKPYVMVLTDLIQKFPIKHSSELLLWMFLESLPSTWKPNKNHIMDHFNISDRTYERFMSYLNATNLIEYRQERKKNGAFGDWKLIVLNGTKFNPDAVSNRTAKIDGTVVKRVKKDKVIHRHRSAKFGGVAETLTTRADTDESQVSPFRQITVERCFGVHINKTIKNKKAIKKTNKDPVVVFSCTESVKNQIEQTVAQRNNQSPLEDDVIAQGVYYAYEANPDKSFESVNKRINIFLKKVRQGKWLIPHNYQGISSQSIRKEEEEHHANKQKQYQQEAETSKHIYTAIAQGQGFKGFSDMFKKMKESIHGSYADEGEMQTHIV